MSLSSELTPFCPLPSSSTVLNILVIVIVVMLVTIIGILLLLFVILIIVIVVVFRVPALHAPQPPPEERGALDGLEPEK